MTNDREYYRAEAKAFVEAHPDYTPTMENQARIFKRLQEKGLEMNRETLELVWKELSAE